jgi:dihydroorotase
VTADTCAHHLALHDGWLGGDRRFAWHAAPDPWRGPATSAAYDARLRFRPPLRSPADAVALAVGVEHGTIDALVSGHEPRRPWQVEVELGGAPVGGSTIETALPVALEAVRAGALSLGAAIRALTAGPAVLLGERHRGIVEGRPAYLTVVDTNASWTPDRATLRSADRRSPVLGLSLRGEVVATIVRGRVAYRRSEVG